jgi:hypothetical protein
MTRIFGIPGKTRKARIALVVLLLGLVMGATYAFTASNTVPASNAGSGSGTISGYVVTANSIHYTINSTNPANLDQVTFTIDNKAGDVKVQTVSGGAWYDCGAATGASAPYTVTCNTTVGTQATVSAANNLTVVAVS